jgi:hypothetical protein
VPRRNRRSVDGQFHPFGTALKTTAKNALKNLRYLPAQLVTDITPFLGDRQEKGAPVPGDATLVTRRSSHNVRIKSSMTNSQCLLFETAPEA